ncbi:AfsR/SARP family transcriptional regulator [Kitasatospora aureofaciens]|uniref:AfsR/SARP family transcriptional regulator n=1 Tax=Kitasatospora aureofaciens TaxID=1894 RepID=UPI0027DFB845|nr:winged helix-turn-helix domain-containing protein [Kitasatospora aureofaciens]
MSSRIPEPVVEGSRRFAVLGHVRAWHRQAPLDLGRPQQQAVLVALLLNPGRPVGRGELIDAVWGEEAPASATTNLRVRMHRRRDDARAVTALSELLTTLGPSGQIISAEA